ncbi:ATP-binding protein Uup [Rhodovastum atsumiense]|uniref:ATP-binding cassette domain-containing protein n=1 Tax=Rhodovastum atsumiense TaxID=504468 RepID=A0A5M6INZ7_9PROT|nr:ATP-binding cassette domain-containing protein [Rhodovastum atsumiense]KAA5609986.1 ATP-binding cassette domain-containing protein [Rhodovastum atsumiense]CAH2598627.1 ATP-binding protein Uup [Rhodovastum atsumiense]
MAPPPLLLLQNIALTLGATPLLRSAELSVGPGERLCLVGRNGSGKSTLLRVAAGLLTPDSGTRFLQPGTTIRTLTQEPDLSGFATTLAFVQAGLGPGDDPHRARSVLEELGLTGEEDPARLSGGEARRAALARVLAPSPDILLLDEPTNHLDLPAIEWLETELATTRAAVVMISHDRRLLEKLSRAVLWLDRGETRRMERGFAAFESWRDEVLEQEERDRHKLARKIVAEEDWLRYGVTARRKRNVRRLGNLHELRARHRAAQGPVGTVKLEAAEGETSGRIVIEARDLAKSFDGRPIVRGLTTKILRGDRVGIVGANGAGKTTLLGLLTGRIEADAGTVKLGASLQMVTLDQRRESLDPAATLADTLTGGHGETVVVNGQSRHVMGYMKDFLFQPAQARTPVGTLSGGERGRLALAVALARPSNLLVLDEPTNDLDLETLDLLQELLADYPGTVLLVSHDRDFLDRVATSVINAEGDGRWVDYAGGFSDMLAQGGRIGGAAAAPVAAAKPRPRSSAEPVVATSRKLSFKDKHALATLPARMEALQADIARHQAALADPDLYRRDAAGFARLSDALAKATADLSAAEERWLELEMLREEVEGR